MVRKKCPSSQSNLWEVLQEVWGEISSDYLNKFRVRMPKVCRAVNGDVMFWDCSCSCLSVYCNLLFFLLSPIIMYSGHSDPRIPYSCHSAMHSCFLPSDVYVFMSRPMSVLPSSTSWYILVIVGFLVLCSSYLVCFVSHYTMISESVRLIQSSGLKGALLYYPHLTPNYPSGLCQASLKSFFLQSCSTLWSFEPTSL